MLGREKPVALLLDDLHWADDASIELVLHLLRRPPRAPHLLVFALRPMEPAPRILHAARANSDSLILPLSPLPHAASLELIGHVADAGMTAVAAKGRALTGLALECCAEHGLDSPTPLDAAARGAHVAVRVTDADAVHAGLTRRGVITDVRRPDIIRLGCAALTTRFVDVWDGVAALADVLAAG